MRSSKIFNGVLICLVIAFSVLCISAESMAQKADVNATGMASVVHDKLASIQMERDPDSFRASDMFLAMVAGIVLVVLQLRRHQKTQSENRINSLHDLQRFNTRIVNHVTQSKLSQAGEAELMAHAERG